MPSSASRPVTRRSPRPAPLPPRGGTTAAGAATRPMPVPFAGVFGLLVAAEDAYFVWLLGFGWYLAVPLVLAIAAVAGVALVWWGRRGGWQLLTAAAVLPLLGLLGLVVLFGYLGGGTAFWSAVLLLLGPLGCLALTLQRSVRTWRGPDARNRSTGGRRAPAGSG